MLPSIFRIIAMETLHDIANFAEDLNELSLPVDVANAETYPLSDAFLATEE